MRRGREVADLMTLGTSLEDVVATSWGEGAACALGAGQGPAVKPRCEKFHRPVLACWAPLCR
jgi:hypothetical protein